MDRLRRVLETLLNPRTRAEDMPPAFSAEAATVGTVSADEKVEQAMARTRRRRRIWRNRPLILGMIIVIGLLLVILIGPLIAPHNPHLTVQATLPYFDAELGDIVRPPFPPSADYLLGTDVWGNDLMSLLMHGARITLIAAAYITLARLAIGAILGSIAGWRPERFGDRIITGVAGVISSVPMLISSMILILAIGIEKGLWVFIVALSIVGWTEIAQYVRGETLVIRNMPYIEGAESIGMKGYQKIVRHVWPNLAPQLVTIAFLEISTVLLLMAELGFLSIFIGGASFFSLDPVFGGQPRVLVEVPEWGALIAQGAANIRANTWILFSPAAAFLIAIIGFNALGEGLRRLIAEGGVNTAVFLQKRMALVLLGFFAISWLIIEATGPELSYAAAAEAFSGEAAAATVATLADMDGRGAGQAGSAAAADYIADKFREYELGRAMRIGANTTYVHEIETRLVQPVTQPVMSLLSADGTERSSLQHQIEFGFVIDGHGGSGDATAQLTLVRFDDAAPDFSNLDLRNRIVVLEEDNAPPDFVTEALRRRAQGVIWLTDAAVVRSQKQLADPDGAYLLNPTLPVVRLNKDSADSIRTQINGAPATQSGPGWTAHDLDLQAVLSVHLTPPEAVSVPSVVGYLAGYEFQTTTEVIVLFASYDGLGIDPDGTVFPAANHNASGVATLLELVRQFQSQNIDPRRTLLFVAWGGSQLDEYGAAQAFLDNPETYASIAVPSRGTAEPIAVIQLDYAGAGDAPLQIDPASDEWLIDLFDEAADIPIAVDEAAVGNVLSAEIPSIHIQWADGDFPILEDTSDNISPERLRELGEALSLMLVRLTRQVVIE